MSDWLKSLRILLRKTKRLRFWCVIGLHSWKEAAWIIHSKTEASKKVSMLVCKRCGKVIRLSRLYPPWR